MKQEGEELILADLCGRVPYKPKLKIGKYCDYTLIGIDLSKEKPIIVELDGHSFEVSCKNVQLVLRPMSSMTEEEFEKLKEYSGLKYDQLDLASYQNGTYKCLDFYLSEVPSYVVILAFEWLNKHHFDYRGLIEKNLASEAFDGMYK